MKKYFTPKSPTVRTPSGVLKLYCTPLTPSYSDSMIFKTEAARESWHNAQYTATASAVTFKNMRPFRAGEEIIVNGDYEKIQKNNYFAYSGDTIIWYGFINGVTYVSENACKISYVIDVIQTFMFDAIIDEKGKSKLPECFVERETVDSDDYFEHIVEEGIGTQTQVIKQRDNIFSKLNTKNFDGIEQKNANYAKLYLLCGKEKFPNGDPTFHALDKRDYQGYNNNAYYFATTIPKELWATLNGLPLTTLYNYPLSNLIGIYPIPTAFVKVYSEYFNTYEILDSITPAEYSLTLPDFIAYVPKNKKLWTKEFCKVKVINTQNGEIEINTNKLFHNTKSKTKTLKCYLSVTSSCGIVITSTDLNNWSYQTTNTDTNDFLILSNQLPSIDVVSDAYTEWKRTRESSLNASLTSSAIKYGLSAVGSIASAGAGNIGALSGLVGSTIDFGNAIAQSNIEEKIAKSNPDSVVVSSSTILDIYNLSYPIFIYSQPALDEIKKIDSYFNSYGYKVNEIKTPALFNRKKWDFIKTSNCHAVGSCSHLYLDKINQIFNGGIRLHHDSFNTITDCTITNAIA